LNRQGGSNPKALASAARPDAGETRVESRSEFSRGKSRDESRANVARHFFRRRLYSRR